MRSVVKITYWTEHGKFHFTKLKMFNSISRFKFNFKYSPVDMNLIYSLQ